MASARVSSRCSRNSAAAFTPKPPTSALYDTSGTLLLKLETTDVSSLKEAGFKFPEPFRVKADDGITDLYGVMYKPFDFDPGKKYPIILYVYPGPQTESVTKAFSPRTTSVTLAQIIFEEEKKTSKMSLRTLKDLIRHGSERAQQLVEDAQADIRERVHTLVPRVQATRDRAKDLVAASQEAVTQFQRRVDERIRAAVDGMANLPELRRDLQQLSARLDDLEWRLADLDR